MKRMRHWLRQGIGKILDLLGRFRLMTTLTVVVIVAVIFFGISLALSNRIAQGLIRSEYEEYNETIFAQAETAISRSIYDMTQLCYTFMSNQNVVDYLQAESFGVRLAMMDDVKRECERLITLQTDIKNAYLYTLDGKLINSAGFLAANIPAFQAVDSITFSGVLVNKNMPYFTVTFPVYDMNNVAPACQGYFQLLVSMDFLEKSLDRILPNQDYFCLVLDNDGHAMLQKGDIPPEVLSLGTDSISLEGQVIYQTVLARTPWQIVFGVPQKQLYANINLLQKNYLVTYFIMGALLMIIFIVIYAGVLRPIHTQILFMNYYARNRSSRMKITSRNEMSELARNLNQMLDDIDQLTAENVEAQQRILEASYQKKQSELFAYRNQVNPHFLRNTFETIRGMALYYHVEDIAAITESLSELFSYNLLGKGYAPLQEVQSHIENYTSIIRYRFNNRYTVSVSMDPDVSDVLFPKMVLQPLVENSIFHGLETVEKGGSVMVEAHRIQDRLNVTVTDNGMGMSQAELDSLQEDRLAYDRTSGFPARKHGIGMINIYRRLRLFYGDSLEFSIESRLGAGTTVRINVPFTTEKEARNDVPGFFD